MKLPVMIQTLGIITGSFLLGASQSLGGIGLLTSKPMSERQIPLSLSAILCARQATAADFFTNGVFDAQVQVVRLTPTAGQKLTRDQARERAKKLATQHEQGSYAYNTCADGGAWALALPVADAVTVENQNLKLPQALNLTCVAGTLKTLFVPEAKGRALALPRSANNVAALPNQRGYASVSCVFKQNQNAGPREIALIPVQGASIDAADVGKKSLASVDKNLEAWVNEKRRLENLPALTANKDLNEAAKSLIGKKLITHNAQALSTARTLLTNKGVEPLGEDRVRGRDINELAGLLWMSPAHRNLILDPSADIMGLAVEQDDGGLFAVFIAGKKLAGSVAKKL